VSPAVKVQVLEAAALFLIAAGLTVFEHSVRSRVALEESGEAWVKAAKVREPVKDGLSGAS
jgi:hypothetical protein